MTMYLDDEGWEDYVITEVVEDRAWYSLSFREVSEAEGHMGVSLPRAECDAVNVVPKAGDSLRLCGSFGFPVRGAIVDGVLIYYRTEAEEQARHKRDVAERQAQRRREFEEKGRAELDAKYNALPPIFQARIDKFRHNNPDFRWEYEGYEMFCCEEAVKLARHLGTVEAMEHYVSLTRDTNIRTDEAQWHREWEEQKSIDRAAGLADGHSGNTHGTAVALAFWYLKQPENVQRMHGALALLVGSFAYGCVPPDSIAEGQQ